MVTECLGSLASYWQKMKHREPEFLHQPSVKLCFALCSAGHWLEPLLRQEGKGSEVMGQWRSGSSGVCQPLSCSLLSASWAVPMSFWLSNGTTSFLAAFFPLSQHCSVVILTHSSAPMILTCFSLRWQIGGQFVDYWIYQALLWYSGCLQPTLSLVMHKWKSCLLPQPELTLASFSVSCYTLSP